MTIRIFFGGLRGGCVKFHRGWLAALRSAATPYNYVIVEDGPPDGIDYVVAFPVSAIENYRAFTKAKAVFSLWAGIEPFLARDDFPPTLPLVHMVEPGLTTGMTEYIVGHVMRWHLDLDSVVQSSLARRWDYRVSPHASERNIGVMGLGALGGDAAQKLAYLGFKTRGWSRSRKSISGIACFAGHAELQQFAKNLDVLIVLLPQTSDTEGLVNMELLENLADGAHLINAARGPIVNDNDLLLALDRPGGLGGATLDVFKKEPLPREHPFWSRKSITITPHLASVTRPKTASESIMTQIERCERGEALHNIVDRARGY
jgi:glyoxylate/hydroxypyruvate reductase A